MVRHGHHHWYSRRPISSKDEPTIISALAIWFPLTSSSRARATAVLMSETGLGSWMVQAGYCPDTIRYACGTLCSWTTSFILASASGAVFFRPGRALRRLFHQSFPTLNWSVETSLCNVAANGLVNLFTNLRLHGRSYARIPYETWPQWAAKLGYHRSLCRCRMTVFMLVLS